MKTVKIREALTQLNVFDKVQVIGNDDALIEAFGFSHANTHLNLCTFLEKKELEPFLPKNVNIVICTHNMEVHADCVIKTSNPRDLFYELHMKFGMRLEQPSLISEKANVSTHAIVSKRNVIIEEDVVVEANAVIHDNVHIKSGSVIRAGAIVGGAGFQMHKFVDGPIHYIEHYGGVLIGNNVEVQQNSCIDKAIFSWDKTEIGDNTKIASQVQIAHGTKIGSRNLIASGSNFGGRVQCGDDNWFGLSSVISNGIKIGSGCRVNLGSVVTKNIENGMSVSGNFAIAHDTFIRNLKGQVK